MGHPPLIAPFLGRCPSCGQAFKASVDLRLDPPQGRATCPWCHDVVELTA